MPTTLAQIDIANMALARLGTKPITDITAQDDIPAEQVRLNWQGAFTEVARETAWNCLLKPVALDQVAQDPIAPAIPVPVPTPWAPATAYAVGDYVNYGDPAYIYQALIANLSSASFVNDLTQGYWFQTDIFNPNPFGTCGQASLYASGWAYKYNLPEDCLLLSTYNDRPCEEVEEEFEVMGASLYSNDPQAIIKYVWADPDTTRYDSLFVNCLVLKLAEKMATILRQDDTTIATQMTKLYDSALKNARTKNASERKARRFSPQANSRWLGSRYYSTNS